MLREIVFLVFDEFQLLDLAGPMAAFEMAQHYSAQTAYKLTVVAAEGGNVASSAGLSVNAGEMDPDAELDTLIVTGGVGVMSAAHSSRVRHFLRMQAAHSRRLCGICTGAYLLGCAGLLNGRRATTHWSQCDDFARTFPDVITERDRIFVRDGNVWTSAGISAGIDLALALIEEDLGADAAQWVAQQLVVYHRRTGGQPQLSSLLKAGQGAGRFGGLLTWIREHIGEQMRVEDLAERANMSPRHFARLFTLEVGMTPAKMVEKIRLEVAQERVERGGETMDRIAEYTGFQDAERMRRAFLRATGQSPQMLRRAMRAGVRPTVEPRGHAVNGRIASAL